MQKENKWKTKSLKKNENFWTRLYVGVAHLLRIGFGMRIRLQKGSSICV